MEKTYLSDEELDRVTGGYVSADQPSPGVVSVEFRCRRCSYWEVFNWDEEFSEYIRSHYRCPSCGYVYSGQDFQNRCWEITS